MTGGMMTKVWGPGCWLFLGCVVTTYPEKIDMKNPEDVSRMKHTLNFFKELAHVLPCKYCRASFIEFSKEIPIDKYLKTRKDLCHWLYMMHEKVNDKLKIPKSERPSLKDVCQKFEQYRAQCNLDKSGCVHGIEGYTSKKCELKIVPIRKENLYKDSTKIDKIISMDDEELKKMQYKLFDLDLVKNDKIISKIVKNNIQRVLNRVLEIYGYTLEGGYIKKLETKEQINDNKLFKHINKFLEKIDINKNPEWLIFGRIACPYCKRAKQLAIQNKLDFQYYEISDLNSEQRDHIFKNQDIKTIPVILKNEKSHYKYIGGYDELKHIMSFKKNSFI